MSKDQDWEQLKEDLQDPKYVEEFLGATLQMIFSKEKDD